MSAGLYVHVPFCLTRCGYCDFNTYANLGHLRPSYVEALWAEADLWADGWREESFTSLFLGGGTPTLLPLAEMVGLLGHLRTAFAFELGAEITSEANPDTVDERYLRGLREAGVTRLSMGLQSFDPAVLRSLERVHSPESAVEAFRAARRAGFDDVNLDLIYGADGESLDSWRATVERTVELEPDHISAYALTIEPATPLGRKVQAGLVAPPDPDLQAEMYDVACEVLGEAGFEHYEISNWGKPGHRCRHNLGYWDGRPYLGLGAGAHSYRDDRRWWNVRPPTQYLEMVGGSQPPIGGEEHLGEAELRIERLFLGLRVADGIPASWVERSIAEPFVDDGLAELRDGRLVLTERGLFVANEVVLALTG